jgi:hypothetical protein
MTRDELKSATLAGIDRVLMLPRLLVGYDSRRLLYAAQSYWQTASDAELDRLLGLVPQAREEEAPPRPKSIEEQLLILDLRQEAMIRLLEEMLDTLARLDPSPFSPQPQQRRDAMSAPNQAAASGYSFAHNPQLAQLHQQMQGFDWSGVNWLDFTMYLIAQILAYKQSHAAKAGTGGGGGTQTALAGCSKEDCLRAHFDVIEHLAASGIDCCDAP